jgi:hypothetical protein
MTEKSASREIVHASDCATHNGPALPPGPCNCGAADAALKWLRHAIVSEEDEPD